MPGPPWRSDTAADEAIIAANVAALLGDLAAVASSRVAAGLDLAHDWHRRIYTGVPSVPSSHYLGQPRGSAHPDLVDYEVALRERGSGRVIAAGALSAAVAGELTAFEGATRTATASLDAALPPGARPRTSDELLAVVELCALVHGEWVRIHPYANGNGRTARTWANWVALRYGLPPFVRIKPRPDGLLYGQAALRSMGVPPDHDLTFQVFVDLLRSTPRGS